MAVMICKKEMIVAASAIFGTSKVVNIYKDGRERFYKWVIRIILTERLINRKKLIARNLKMHMKSHFLPPYVALVIWRYAIVLVPKWY